MRPWLPLTLLATAVLGVGAALELHASPFGQLPVLDEESYLTWARSIAAGDWVGDKAFYQDPLYPYLLAVLMRVLGASVLALRLLQVGFLTGAVWAVFVLGRRVFGSAEGALAAGLVALYGAVHLDAANIGKESLLLLGCALSCLLAVRATAESARARTWFAVGACLGVLALMRGNFLLLLPLAAVWAGRVSPAPTGRGRVLAGALVLLGGALAVAPVTVRNAIVSGELIPTTWGAGTVLYLGNGPSADGTYGRLPFVRPTPLHEGEDFTAEAERRLKRKLGPGEVSRYWGGEALRHLAGNPGQAARLWFRKWHLLLGANEVPGNYSLSCLRERFVPTLRFPFLGFGLLLGPALAGAAVALRRRSTATRPGAPEQRAAVLLALYAVSYAFSVTLFFVLGRYRAPLVPVVAVFAAHAAVCAVAWARARRWRPLAAALAFAAAVTLLQQLPARGKSGARELAHCLSLAGATYEQLGRMEEALPLLEEATALAPRDPEVRYNLGAAQDQSGNRAGAEASYREVLDLDPGNAQAHFNLGLIELASGRARDARAHFAGARAGGLPGPQAALAEGAALEALGDPAAARALYRELLKSAPDHPQVLERALRAALWLGDCAEARLFAAAARDRRLPVPNELLRRVADACGP